MPPPLSFQYFEIVTQRGVRFALHGALMGWADKHEHRVTEHAILGRAGAIHQSNAQAPRRFPFQLLLLDEDGSSATDKYKALESTLAQDPFGLLTHPRLGGGIPYVYRTLAVSEDLDGSINGLTAELHLDETGLRDVQAQSAAIAARAARSAAEALLNQIGSIIARVNNTSPPSIADLASLTPLALDAPAAISSLVSLGATLYGAVNSFIGLADDATTDQYTLAAQLVQVGTAAEAFAAEAAGALDIKYQPLIADARLAYGQALAAFQETAVAAGRVPVVSRRVPGKMSVARWAQSLYGGGAQAQEDEILRLNQGRIPFAYALTPGTDYLVPDPARVKLDEMSTAEAG